MLSPVTVRPVCRCYIQVLTHVTAGDECGIAAGDVLYLHFAASMTSPDSVCTCGVNPLLAMIAHVDVMTV